MTAEAFLVALSALSVLCALVSVGLHYRRVQEHPDVASLRAELHALQLEHADLADKTVHWMARERTRKLRASQERPAEEPESQQALNLNPHERKQQLKARLLTPSR